MDVVNIFIFWIGIGFLNPVDDISIQLNNRLHDDLFDPHLPDLSQQRRIVRLEPQARSGFF